jgi:phosphoribosyl-AMP cyclohydrolase
MNNGATPQSKHEREIPLEELFGNRQDRIPVITVEQATGRILGLNMTDRAAFDTTVRTGQCHYYDEINDSVFLKGEHSGEIEHVIDIRLDCCHARRHELHLLYLVLLDKGKCMFGVSDCHFYQFEGDRFVFDRSLIEDEEAVRKSWHRIQTILTTEEDRNHQRRFGKNT